ncbi:hypothetical protein QBC33DRAFT_532375 [Phialemonium atrogriseum]|uniref:Midasin n=1 Tax=Phialemonium atrogriseum TaxID=1093897 RepID=A0AAJ0C2V6_9PEZI|nr:uncharacterized protein QBC33DRAFT_532375 [Phialemonium atrogriseum]KAK1769134.1 hypothetical protein QBC33DRAFT_532375 [Phialemonium atrogriseum]
MAVIDVSSQRASLLSDATALGHLPPELLHIVRDHQSHSFLDAIAAAALIPRLTGRIFAHFEAVFADICARWLLPSKGEIQDVQITTSFARILPFAPYLSVFLQKYLRYPGPDDEGLSLKPLALDNYEETHLVQVLLAIWRLNSFDKRTYSGLTKLSDIQALFKHENAAVRYLSIRIFCQLLEASDFKLEALIEKHIRKGELLVADFDGQQADLTFLSLYEHARAKEIQEIGRRAKEASPEPVQPPLPAQKLTPLVINYGSSVFPRPLGPVHRPASLVPTPTTLGNLERLINLLQNPGPILLHGLSGAGKTSLIHEVARQLGKDNGLVTLHLNDQTDAKMLLGLYTTDSKPGSFQWRPGVLTTAVKEGRWVLIEDLDRAPTEVMSTLLPLVERGELLIPSRGERIQASDSFRIFATVRTSLGMNGQENLPSLIGLRLWQPLPVQSLPQGELRDIVNGSHPRLHKYTPGILSVFDRLLAVSNGPSSLALGRGMMDRPISTRDLLKWCRRLDHILTAVGCKSGDEPISETTRDWMFMEAVDCFISCVKEEAARGSLVAKIAEEMHISSKRVRHYLNSHVPKLEATESHLTTGRVSLRKTPRPTWVAKQKRPFATTTHAKRLLEQVAAAVKMREPVLLVGETGIGKTTVVQQLAESLGHKLVAVNLSQQSEASDLLGGFKPVNSRSLAVPLKDEFEDLFEKTGVSADKNQDYLDRISKRFAKGRWTEVAKEWHKAPKMFETILSTLQKSKARSEAGEDADGQPAKRRKTDSGKLQRLLKLKPRWDAFAQRLEQFEIQITSGSGAFAFAFVEGNVVKAARNGDWVLLDEINLASPDTLESIAGLLHSGSEGSPSILLSETGEIERINAHPDFRVFGAMNPATDVGKRDLPLGLRSRFTEIYVVSPDKDKKDLLTIIKTYLVGNNSRIDQVADSIADLYLEIKALAESKKLVDGANEVPHFSLRTLTRVLTYANDVATIYGIERALYEGFCMGFLTLLSQDSEREVMPRIQLHLLRRPNILSQPPKRPTDGRNYVSFKNRSMDHQYWVLQGDEARLERSDYIITPYVERNLLNLVRATSTRRYPILIQGPTSSGKTSMIEYLANFSGNKFVRINNHEHTDLQEYLGTYVSGNDGKLKFQEGLLVQAMRQGSWIVLDELNLAPTDVLEALNRLLDDNRELLIPETQEVVRPHENFMIFATQNPPGLYGGRKVLSRAFRNRFLELHFDDIPEDELETILQMRSRNTAPSDCRRIVSVYKQLSRLRQESRVFEQKNSFATLRDLFRWAMRDADNRDQVASNGFMLLAERVRKEEERLEVKRVIEEVFKVKIDLDVLYDRDSSPGLRHLCKRQNSQGVVWTKAMRRLYVLVERAIQNNEPVLLVGETGCGKTTVCQLLAEARETELHIVNAHQNTETGDLIGSQRPVRNRGAILDALKRDLLEAAQVFGKDPEDSFENLVAWYQSLPPGEVGRLPGSLKTQIDSTLHRSRALFEWCDGSLVHAMKMGQFFLLDEISLADDSVLERLNSVLEPHRSLLLAEKGVDDSFVRAHDGFQFFATMNPGGDFGKKELSPALRNRFTEIWVPALSEDEDVLDIVISKLAEKFRTVPPGAQKSVSEMIVGFTTWFGKTFRPSSAAPFSLRDILTWVTFMNQCGSASQGFALLHGAATVFIDTLGANPSALIAIDPRAMDAQRQLCLDKLSELAGCNLTPLYRDEPHIHIADHLLSIGDFSIERRSSGSLDSTVDFQAITTKMNAMRVIRALQINKPVLLEGSPGVGKTTLVSALARVCGRPLTRINLSDQTDLMDLFGTDVPVEGAEAGNFAWKDAPFLQAMQKGEWVLLDEMNLASQSVLEGLNACLDHRGEVYISELDQVFKRHPEFRLFAAQNPHHQGGGRKGLPSSFVNRFIVVYADVFTEQDLLLITQSRFRDVAPETIHQMIGFISRLDDEVVSKKSFGSQGSPWEFNLRDTLRWLDLLASSDPLIGSAKPDDLLDIIIRQRFRTDRDRIEVTKLFATCFQRPAGRHSLYHDISDLVSQVGIAALPRSIVSQPTQFPAIDVVPRLAEVESVMIAVKQDLPCILVGPSGSGKSALLRHVAALAGKALVIFPLNADVDTMDLIGGFEQADPHRELQACLGQLRVAVQEHILSILPRESPSMVFDLISLLGVPASGERRHRDAILLCVERLLAEGPMPAPLSAALSTARDALLKPLTLENPRFEWLDGVIVRAIETGQWLVLDNANLCSASVLDRLNSLLERPDGFLSINEHSGPGGEPRVIRPHPNFRIFLTLDPRYGELSRAMRNRSVEVYLGTIPQQPEPYLERITPIEASLRRFHTVNETLESLAGVDHPIQPASSALGLLSAKDMAVLEKFGKAVELGLFASGKLDVATLLQSLGQLLSYISSKGSRPVFDAISELYRSTAEKMSPSLIRTHLGSSIPSQEMLSSYLSRVQLIYPTHPLQNDLILPLLDGNMQENPHWLAICYEYCFEIQSAMQAMESQMSKVNVTRPSSLNRFQRSCISDQVATVSKDSTVHVSKFLSSTLGAIDAYLKEHLNDAGTWTERRLLLRKLMHYWKRTFDFVCGSPFDEARFQAHLGQGLSLWKNNVETVEVDTRTMATSFLERLEGNFVVGFKLLTGLSMEVLWNLLRPQPIRDVQCLEQVAEMERLAARFDTLRWKADATVQDLSSVLESLSKAYAIIRTNGADAADLVKDLTTEISSLEAKIGEHARDRRPFLANGFEALRQTLTLHQISNESVAFQRVSDVTVLSDMPTLYQMHLHSPAGTPTAFQSLDYLLAQDTETRPWTATVSESLLLKFDSIKSASLFELRSLEEELPKMGRALVEASEALGTDPIPKLNSLLSRLMADVMGAHSDSLRQYVLDVYRALFQSVGPASVSIGESGLRFEPRALPSISEPPTAEYPHFLPIFREHILPSLIALTAAIKGIQPRSAYASIAWVHFAQGCIKLYVPDKVFDPYLRAQVELDFHEQLRDALEQKISALSEIEHAFTGRRTNLRCALLEDELRTIGEPPPLVQTIYRPSGGDLSRLQGEFNNILNIVVRNDVTSSVVRHLSGGSESDAQELRLVNDNISRLIQRVSGQFKAYQDMTSPLVNFLRCLQIGLSLSDGVAASNRHSKELASLLKIPTFLDGSAWDDEEVVPQTRNLEFLSFIASVVSIEGLDKLSGPLRQSLFDSLAFYYEEWSKKLQADRKAREQNQSLYRFRGSLEDQEEDDEEEFNELFPDYYSAEDDKPKKKPTQDKYKIRDVSVILAESHANIFLSSQDAQGGLQGLCKQIGRKVSGENRRASAGGEGMDRILLAPALLVFDEQLTTFRTSLQSDMYNFYTDPNVFEIRKLLTLVGSIKSRFQDLQAVDEIGHHHTLTDVIVACDKLLDFNVEEPLAKFITGVEYLHSFVYEWQEGGWASHVHKATPLYERLTNTIHDWRRLELSSWARLFDTEEKKCHDEARSWWFIAYGAIVVQPCLKLQEGQQNLRSYAIELLQTLETYFADAVVGQFAARLSLLKQLKNQLDLLVQEAPALGVVRDATQNFISVYGRYEKKAAEFIRAGRAPLDRKMKDVLLLFSWRDKNISALRESSRKSHQKLFKLVRKFRGVLGQPMRSILDQGLPDEEQAEDASAFGGDASRLDIDGAAASLCSQLMPRLADDTHWQRLSNPAGIVKVMAKIGSLPESVIEGAHIVDSFISDLLASMASLKKETPAILTDENKDEVKHLKTRKTRLFVDTLKTMRQMGFSRSPSTNVLERQRSTAVVLVDSAVLQHCRGFSPAEMEYYYHKLLDLAARFRAATHEHSGDLSREAVDRCVGYLEGTLHTVIQQRRDLCQSVRSLGAVERAIADVEVLSSPRVDMVLGTENRQSNSVQVLRWLVQMLKFAVHLVHVHAKLGGVNNRDAMDKLGAWVGVFESHLTRRASLPKLPSGFETSEHSKLQTHMEADFGKLREMVRELGEARPDLAFVLEQIEPWTTVRFVDAVDGGTAGDVDAFVGTMMTASKKLLVAIQEVEKLGKSLPTSTEDPAWLVKYSGGLASRNRSLRMETVAQEVSGVILSLKDLDLGEDVARRSATALLRVVLPLLQQYASICRQNIARFANLHRALCRMGYNLGKSFVQIASQGFCTPQEKGDEKSGDSGQLESGTGLGEGEGAEDISKDIQPDEDLEELAQEPNNKPDNDIEDQEDAVDMGMDDLEGELGSVGGKDEEDENGSKNGDEDDEENEMDEEAGDVDDLDPTAVDEKMWDGDKEEEAEKDQQGDNKKGEKKEEQVGADDARQEEDQAVEPEEQGDQGEEEAGAEQEEGVAQEELNNQDQNVPDNETLALPEDMEIDIDDNADEPETDDDLDKLSDIEDPREDPEAQLSDAEDNDDDAENGEPRQEENDLDAAGVEEEIEDQVDGKDTQSEMEVDEEQDPDEAQDEEKPQQPALDEGNADPENAAPSDVQAGGGQAETEMDAEDEEDAQKNTASQREQGDVGQNSADQETAAGNEGSLSKSDQEHTQPEDDTRQESSKAHPFKKLGDALERWHRNQKDIEAAAEGEENQQKKDMTEAEMAKSEFQHLQDENAPEDTQAMGGATDEEVRPLDDAMAIDTEADEAENQLLAEDAEDEEMKQDDKVDDASEQKEPQDSEKSGREEGRSGVATLQGAYNVNDDDDGLPTEPLEDDSEDEEIQETSTQLSTTHITEGDETLRDFSEALQLWATFQAKTHPLSLSLTSQLRLILTPSQSTKLSGSFRTGKRLNIKKIIPYIASSYKRDKIWMRRSIPTKRSYQILLCVDDSRSMGDSASGALALESLVMVSRSLAMLEAGQVGVLGFGSDVFVAHDLAEPFASHDAGARALRRFTFRQDATDVARLLRRTIDQFRLARLQNAAGSGAGGRDLWQLALILSDGLTPSGSHARIRPLLREAMEERVMVVFIIMDGAGRGSGGEGTSTAGTTGTRTGGGDSVLELKEARFTADGGVVVERYLDSFPFPYYLIVHHLDDLPSALAGLLRTWFAEVNS